MTLAPGSLAFTNDVAQVVMVAASALGVTEEELVGSSKRRPLTEARHVAMRAARLGGSSFPAIGDAFDRDHSTVISACRRVERAPHLEARARAIADDIANTPRSLF